MKQRLGILPAESYYGDTRLRRRFWLMILKVWEYIAYEEDEDPARDETEVNGMSKKDKGKKPQPEAKTPPAKPEATKSQDKTPKAEPPQAPKPVAAKPSATKPATTPRRPSTVKKQETAPEPAKKTSKAIAWGIILAFVVAAVVLIGFVAYSSGKNATKTNDAKSNVAVASSPVSSPTATPTATATPTPTPTPTTSLDPRFVQESFGTGGNGRVVVNGLPGKTAKQLHAAMLRIAGHNAQALAIWAFGSNLWPDPNNTAVLLTPDGTYLSQEGMMLWASLQGALNAEGTKVSLGQAPSNWVNSGVSQGKFGQAGVAGITGNRTALVITWSDGSKTVVMKRCGNLAFPHKGNLPVVPTDNLKPKNAKQDAYAQGHATHGGGPNATKGPGAKTPKPKKPGPTPYTPPPSPKPTPTPTPSSSATPDSAPTPTPTTSTTPTGTVTPPGTGTGG
jgi:outer membrane biosynthesis protein TonB